MAFNRSSHKRSTQGGSSSSHIMCVHGQPPPPPERDWYIHDLPVSRNIHPCGGYLLVPRMDSPYQSEDLWIELQPSPPPTHWLFTESHPCSSPPRCSSLRLIEKLSARLGLRSTPTHHPERLQGWVPVRSLTALSLSLSLLRQRASRNPPDPRL